MPQNKRQVSSAEKRIRRALAANIERHLKKRGWSVVHLAETADVSKSLVYELLAAERAATIDVLARLAGPLRVEPWEMIKSR